MYDTPTANAIRASLRTIVATDRAPTDGELAGLRDCVFEATDELMALTDSPEHVVIRLKQVASEVLPISLSGGERQMMIDHIVRWCVERYFGR